ncbi:disease resistance protein Pik-2-like isoform X2 [Quercus lobata]|uniref:disease resistance protein Pik-2-like isoform X2 n=1 Tax=Quercus lobata TaxID=97700 RepID=UPI001247F62E|nr:disease resistance protein Pik-2-like isoform X2 [Quercus lobata]
MAEGALFHLAEKVLELLRSLTLQEVKLASSVKRVIEKLTNTVSTIQAVILDAEKQSSQDHQIKDWLRKLKDILHDADDLLDDFSTDVLQQKVMTKKELFIFKWLNLLDLVAPSTAAASTSSPNTSETQVSRHYI